MSTIFSKQDIEAAAKASYADAIGDKWEDAGKEARKAYLHDAKVHLDAAEASLKARGAMREGVTLEENGRWHTNDAAFGLNNITGQFSTAIIRLPMEGDT